MNSADSRQKDKVSSVSRYNDLSQQLHEKKKVYDEKLEQMKKLKSSDESKEKNKDQIIKLGNELNLIQSEINQLTKEWRKADPDKLHINREEFNELLTRRFFVVPSFEIYGQTAGLYDYGPPACAIKTNILNLWRQHFILNENMHEVDCVCLTPEPVFVASGHVERFTDYMVKDLVNHECYRADKLVSEYCETQLQDPNISTELSKELADVQKRIDSFGEKELGQLIRKYNIKSQDNNDLSEPYRFNLMFSTPIGPTGKVTGYLRPETAQGIFVNFKRLYDYNGNRMPFAGATVGQAFRNEISPRSGLLRVREFTLAEVEHFCNPDDKSHPKYDTIKNVVMTFLSRNQQTDGVPAQTMTVDEAVQKGLILNQTHAYFIARTQLFMLECGVLPSGIRFRQHLSTEMAHYASDCWDCELLTSYGWIECVGIADRACFDLQQHADHAKVELVAYEQYKEPKFEQVILPRLDKKKISKVHGAKTNAIITAIEKTTQQERKRLREELQSKGHIELTITMITKSKDGDKKETHQNETVVIESDLLSFEDKQNRINGYTYVPSVIEPSFGIGRIIYCILEHSYWVRKGGEEEEEQGSKSGVKVVPRAVLSLPPAIAPYKVAVLPMIHNDKQYQDMTNIVINKLVKNALSYKVDTSGQSIGRRYCRCDDVGAPFVITIDSVTLQDQTVTLRERDSCEQLRIPVDQVSDVISQLINNVTNWQQVKIIYPEQKQTASEQVGKGK
jgi:glycyl-tRNA synthetase